ncbi:hypothetical protein [Deinococcus aquatilis]|uniref:hypothetical protein n=1 Tax=Deinococcus aquatilis TaxID=519440 RepID=UPI00037D79B5|nr:hypothetical protein [Deinococcus aquatilis]
MIDPDFAARVAQRAYASAWGFFQPSPEWLMEPIEAKELPSEDGTGEAVLWFRIDYLRAKVVYDPARHDDGAHLWRNMGHEVAHLLLMEYDAIQQGMKGTQERAMTHANERAVTRLDRLFMRERPYPGDEAFAGPAP